LGEGGYGKVCVGKWRAAPVALKFCKNKGKLDEFINEIKLMLYAILHQLEFVYVSFMLYRNEVSLIHLNG